MTKDEFRAQLEIFQRNSLRDGRFNVNAADCIPCLNDGPEGEGHSYCPVYLYHTYWGARVLAQSCPAKHIDFGGLVYFTGIASALVPDFRFYDIRPIKIPLPGISTGAADFTKLPFETGSLNSVSSMHCLEHIGLGRYGDTLDVTGDLKAAFELHRVAEKGGQLLLVVPVGRPRVVFNAHRIYSYEQVIDMFSGFYLKEFTLVDPPQYLPHADPAIVKNLTEGAGCFWMIKR